MPAQRQRTTGERLIAKNMIAHWDDISQVSAYVVQFDGSSFISRQVQISAVAATPSELNLVAMDYRCGFCKADQDNVEALMRAHPHHNFVFIESAILGPGSIKLAERAVSEASFNPQGYYAIHRRYLGGGVFQTAPASADAQVLVQTHLRIASEIRINTTPTYIVAGVPHVGTITSTY